LAFWIAAAMVLGAIAVVLGVLRSAAAAGTLELPAHEDLSEYSKAA